MINPFEEINWKPERKDIRKFGNTIFIGFSIISFFLLTIYFVFHSKEIYLYIPLYLVFIGFVIFMFSLLLPSLIRPIYYIWYFISACIGIVVSNLMLLIIYYVIFSPFAIIFRTVSRRDPLRLKKNNQESFWIDRKKKRSLKTYFRQY